MATKTYTGGCHCGANTFSVSVSPPLENQESKVLNCNCSICDKNGYLLTFVPASAITWKTGSIDNLTSYEFNKKMFQHCFCPICGTSVAAKGGDTVGLNVRAFDDVDVEKLTLQKYDGKKL